MAETQESILTPQSEFEQFQEIQNFQNLSPVAFTNGMAQMARLSQRLQYKFLELDSKLRFLRYLSQSNISIPNDPNQIEHSQKFIDLQQQLEISKKETRSIRKKIGKCVYQNEVRRCLDGKQKLQSEIAILNDKILELENWFKSINVLGEYETWKELPENGIFEKPDKLISKLEEHGKNLDIKKMSLSNKQHELIVANEKISADLEKLRQLKNELTESLEALKYEKIDSLTKEKIERISQLKKVIELWNFK
ncbi:hypothetical protein DAMA08_024760 [Martiniozyma asiatica (nom. inval.)]|nr:hypothetical protein DAMA08_024760 [Martiniozyma asiatica]